MCVFVVLGLVFPYQAKRLSWGNARKMTYFVSSWTQNFNSINQSVTRALAITIYLLTAASKLLLYCTAAASLIWRHWSVCHAVIISVAPPVGSPVCRYHVLCQFSSVVARPLKGVDPQAVACLACWNLAVELQKRRPCNQKLESERTYIYFPLSSTITDDFWVTSNDHFTSHGCPMRALGSTLLLIHLLISALCMFVYIICTYPFFFTFSLLIFSFENTPAAFPGQRS